MLCVLKSHSHESSESCLVCVCVCVCMLFRSSMQIASRWWFPLASQSILVNTPPKSPSIRCAPWAMWWFGRMVFSQTVIFTEVGTSRLVCVFEGGLNIPYGR